MKISSSLAQLNFDRFQKFQNRPNQMQQHKQFTLKGDTYVGLKAKPLHKMICFAQQNLLIISGLYGMLNLLMEFNPIDLRWEQKLT